MTVMEVASAIPSWSKDERLQLLDELWASLDRDQYVPDLTPELRQLLDERIAHANAQPEDVVTWEELKAELHRERVGK